MEIKRAIIATSIVWVLGVSAYILSHFVKIMDNPELQANVVLTLALIPSAILGTKFYYKNGAHTNGFKLGIFMFLITIGLDAIITVPVFIIPTGGDHLSFFSDPGFWFIGLVYILVVILYTGIRSKMRTSKL
jgi:hypothetical protein